MHISFKSLLATIAIVGTASASLTLLLLSLILPYQSSHASTGATQIVRRQVSPTPNILARMISAPTATPIGAGLPIRLKIPKIKVNAMIENVGLTAQGALDVAKGPTNAGWFDLAPRPGDNGNAVISGHYGYWQNGQKAVFDDLHKLIKGDTISVEDAQGAIITFVVSGFRTYGQNEDAPSVFASSDNKAHLNLVTCSGAWNTTDKVYPTRLVVFADKATP